MHEETLSLVSRCIVENHRPRRPRVMGENWAPPNTPMAKAPEEQKEQLKIMPPVMDDCLKQVEEKIKPLNSEGIVPVLCNPLEDQWRKTYVESKGRHYSLSAQPDTIEEILSAQAEGDFQSLEESLKQVDEMVPY